MGPPQSTPPFSPPPVRRRWTLALVGSGALHALLLAFLWSRGPLEPSAPAERVISFNLVPARPPPAVEPRPAPEAPRAPPRERRPAQRAEEPSSQPPADRTQAPSVDRASGSINLVPSAEQLSRAGVPLAVAPVRERAAPGPSRWQRGLADLQRRQAGRAAIEARKAPPETFDLLRDMEKIYEPSHELILALVKKHPGWQHNVDRWLGRYLQGFGRKPDLRPGEPFDRTAAFVRGVNQAALKWGARVCVTFRPGAEPLVEVDVSSGLRALDQIAVQTVTRAAQRRQGLVPQTRACYLFDATLTRIPPVPVLACGIGAHGPECIYPLKEIASTHVTLDGIEPVEPLGTPAPPGLAPAAAP